MQKIVTFLWFDNQAEQAVDFYLSIFKNSKVLQVSRWEEGGPRPKGEFRSARFQLEGQEFHALNGGPHFQFTPAISLMVNCETQEEVDTLWQKFCEGGEPGRCGWLKDKFGLSWQIIPTALGRLIGDKNPQKAARVMQAMLQMNRIEIAKLQQAYDQA